MKHNFRAFTLNETVVTMAIIGVIAALTLPIIGQKVDRNKALFKKAYSTTERALGELVNDEYYYPYDLDNFGFKEMTNVKIAGTKICATDGTQPDGLCQSVSTTGNETAKWQKRLKKFCNLFTNNLSTSNVVFNNNKKPEYCTFKTSDGIEWKVEVANENKPQSFDEGFMITIDTNGAEKGVSKPASVKNVCKSDSNRQECKNVSKAKRQGDTINRDKFFMYVNYDGKMMLPDNDEIASKHLSSSDMNREENQTK